QRLSKGLAGELVFGHYVVLDLLGEGGMGRVYKARHRGMKRLVALKVIRRDMVSDAETVGRFYREMKLASQLSHPNIIRAYDAGPVGVTHFLALEYVEGIDLEHQVRQSGPLPVVEACEYIRQAACGLAHAYEKGLVHRDIKPSNLLISEPGPKGTGFGQIK